MSPAVSAIFKNPPALKLRRFIADGLFAIERPVIDCIYKLFGNRFVGHMGKNHADRMPVSGAIAKALPDEFLAGAKSFLIGVFEWFGELSLFLWRLLRTAILPLYEFCELLKQCDIAGAKSLPSEYFALEYLLSRRC
jgi:hypothetical protein